MIQIATVTGVPAPGEAVVSVVRQSACGHDCETCAGCGAQGGSLTVRAVTEIPVAVGDRVEIYSGNSRVLGIAALVYLAPVALFLAGYLLSGALPETMRYRCGGMAFLLGMLGAVALDRLARRRGGVVFRILRKV